MKNETRECLECGDILRGRIDQKFCSDQCRTTFNNQLNRDINNQVRNVNNILRRNRRILENLSLVNSQKIERETMISKGFNFDYHTSTYTNKKGQTYYFCYEQGYLRLNEKIFFLVKNQITKF